MTLNADNRTKCQKRYWERKRAIRVTQDPGLCLATGFFFGLPKRWYKSTAFWAVFGSAFLGLIFSHIKKVFFIPSPISVLLATWKLATDGTLFLHLKTSFSVLGVGVATAVVFGFVFGVLIHQFPKFRRPALAVVDTVRPVAAIALFPVFILLFGLGFLCKAATIFWTAWPPVLLSTVDSLGRVDRCYLDAAENMGAGKAATLFHISLPIALPGILTGIRTGAGTGWISLVAAEMLGSNSGLGFFVLLSSQTFDYAGMFAGIILIAVTGLAVNQLLLKIQGACEL